ncbi:hypothetical protein G6030_15440 [Dietzia sp. E1]|uniref:hypothetical protein n=1 Tax=Dietzia sp. E1 TaxID=328361 RepID=UPI0015FBD552|nr:hypothetical protein [Dietzia sp. E1]MBB1022662.1 hypothetical protein [Dietzia sp. E1]
MKNSKRMMAVIAASGLVLGGMPGIANAQTGSEGLLDLNLGVNVGDSVELGVDLGLGSLGLDEADLVEFPDLAGSLDAATDASGSSDLDTGSENLDDDVIGDLIDAGSAEGGSGSASNDDGNTEDGNSGSANAGSGSASNDDEDAEEGDIPTGSLGSITDGLGSADDETEDEDEETPGSLEDLFGTGSASSSDTGSGSADEGNDEDDEIPGEDGDEDETSGDGSVELNAETVLAVGSLAAAGIAAGIAVSGGVDLPALPAVDVGIVCELPQEGIDFLKGNGSMQPDECLPEEQN